MTRRAAKVDTTHAAVALPLQMGYNWPTQIRWSGECSNTPRPWPTGGDPVDAADSTIPAATIERFWSGVDRSGGPDACWPWMRYRDRHGYGQLRFLGRPVRCHRVAMILSGDRVDGLAVCHRCDNPRCCNPAHLFTGAQSDNVADMIAKGRMATGDASGARRNPRRMARYSVNEETARFIRADLARGLTQAEAARRHLTTQSTVSRIALGTHGWAVRGV